MPPTQRTTNAHAHTWRTRSYHPTSEGTVSYQHCRCGQWRVLLGPNCMIDDDHSTPCCGHS